jgi:hypothetical protein
MPLAYVFGLGLNWIVWIALSVVLVFLLSRQGQARVRSSIARRGRTLSAVESAARGMDREHEPCAITVFSTAAARPFYSCQRSPACTASGAPWRIASA